MLKKVNYPTYNWELISELYTNDVVGLDIELHSHTFWEISITKKGDYINHFTTGDIHLYPYNMIIIRPFDVHYLKLQGTNCEYRDIYITDEQMKELCMLFNNTLYDYFKNSPQPIVCKIDKAHADSIEATSLSISSQKISMNQEDINAIDKCLIIKCIDAYLESKIKPNYNIPQWLLSLVDQINVYNFTNIISTDTFLKSLIENSGYSHGHVCREFKKYFNTTLISYINKKKLQYSTSLLLSNNISINEISQTLGYSCQSNYINAFKKEYGLSPSSWKSSYHKITKEN